MGRMQAIAVCALAVCVCGGCGRGSSGESGQTSSPAAGPPVASAGVARADARQQVQLAAEVSQELASKAELADPKLLRRSGMSYGGWHGSVSEDSRIFPRTRHIRRYETVRPWSVQYSTGRPMERSPWSVEPWPAIEDAPGLRKMLTDRNPRVRSLAVEALATLNQPEDIPLIARLLDDSSEGAAWLDWGMQRSAQFIPELMIREDVDKVELLRAWRPSQVRDYAGRAIEHMTGEKLDSAAFPAWWRDNKDARNSLWYWEQRIKRERNGADQSLIRVARAGTGRGLDSRRARSADAKRKALVKVLGELKRLSPETEAKVVLLSDIRWRDAHGGVELFTDEDIVGLRIPRARLLDLMDRKGLWPDVDWKVWYRPLVRRIAPLSDKLFQPADVGRLREVMRREFPKGDYAYLQLGIARLLPPATVNPDDPGTRDGELRAAIARDRSEVHRGFYEAELVRVGLPANWGYIKDKFFSETAGSNSPRPADSILQALGDPPLTPEKRRALIDLLTDEKYKRLWTLSPRLWGDDGYREYAARSLNAHAGYKLISYKDLDSLKKPETAQKALAALLNKIRNWAKEAK